MICPYSTVFYHWVTLWFLKSCFLCLVDKCVRGRNFTVEDFKWDFPPKCFGTCETQEFRGKREPIDFLHALGITNGYIYGSKMNQCTLPCMSYSGSKSPKECLINGAEKNAYLAFKMGGNECEGCEKAKWSECWPTNRPGKMFTSKHGTNPYYWLSSLVQTFSSKQVVVEECGHICLHKTS